MRLNPVALGIGLGAVWGVMLCITTWLSYYTGYARLFLEVLGESIYPFYAITPAGGFLGLLYGFIDGFVSGALIGWVYNRVAGARG